MGKNNLITIVFIFATTIGFAQVKFGAKAGAKYSVYEGKEAYGMQDYYEYKPGFYVGGFVNVPIGVSFSVQGDLLFSQTGAILDYTEEPYDFKRTVTDYAIAVPVMLRYNFFGFYAEAGGQVNFGLSREYEYEGYEPQYMFYDDNDGTDIVYGIAFGIGYNISDHFSIGGRYFIESNNDELKEIARVFSFGVGYSF